MSEQDTPLTDAEQAALRAHGYEPRGGGNLEGDGVIWLRFCRRRDGAIFRRTRAEWREVIAELQESPDDRHNAPGTRCAPRSAPRGMKVEGRGMTQPDDQPPTITEMLAELGAAHNYAEQCLMREMRKLERKQAEAEAAAEGGEPGTRREYYRRRADDAWDEALAYQYAIETFRQWGATPVMGEK